MQKNHRLENETLVGTLSCLSDILVLKRNCFFLLKAPIKFDVSSVKNPRDSNTCPNNQDTGMYCRNSGLLVYSEPIQLEYFDPG